MLLHSWLIALATLTITTHAWPQLPHFELQQAGTANVDVAQRSIKSTCKRIAALTNLSKMAANQTRLATMLADKKLSQEQIDYIGSKKNAIDAELQELSSNTTLAAECSVISAHGETVKSCKKLDKLEKLVVLANNKTAYDEHLAGELLNQKQTEQLKKNMEDAEIKLQQMLTNSTLVRLCTNEIGLQQNGAAGQQVGDIGEASVDNSGAISLSTSVASTTLSTAWAMTCVQYTGLFIALVLV